VSEGYRESSHFFKMIDPDDKKPAEQKKEPADSNKVPTAEEQMERFEEDLKENDWGHQPC
jgi:hypothetical protein